MKNIIELLSIDERKNIKEVTLQKEQILFNEGDVCECVGIVISGVIEITSYSYNGREIIFNHLESGMLFGNNLILSSEPIYKGSIIAKTPTKIALIYKNALISLLQNNKSFLLEYLKHQSDMSKELNGKIKLLTLDSAEERFFLYLTTHKGKIKYQTISGLAKELYLQRETLSRLLTKLVKENKISINNKAMERI